MSIWDKDIGELLFRRRIRLRGPTTTGQRRASLELLLRELAFAVRHNCPLDLTLRSMSEEGTNRFGPTFLLIAVLVLLVAFSALGFVTGWAYMPKLVAAPVLVVVGVMMSVKVCVTAREQYLQYVAERLTDLIAEGRTLSQAMERMPRAFTRQQCKAVAIGEQTGRLAESLETLAEDLRLSQRFAFIASAIMYPATLLMVAVTILTFIRYRIVPKYVDIFHQIGMDLPVFSQRVLIGLRGSGGFLDPYFWLTLLVVVAIGGLVLVFYFEGRRKGLISFLIVIAFAAAVLLPPLRGEEFTGNIVADMIFYAGAVLAAAGILVGMYHLLRGILAVFPPPVRRLITRPFRWLIPLRETQLARFLLSLGLSLRARIPASEALEWAGETVRGRLRRDARRMKAMVEQGRSLLEALQTSPLFHGQVGALLSLGEWHGTVADDCVELADELRAQAEGAVARLSALVEYLSNLLLGIIIGLFVVACYLPLFYIPMAVH